MLNDARGHLFDAPTMWSSRLGVMTPCFLSIVGDAWRDWSSSLRSQMAARNFRVKRCFDEEAEVVRQELKDLICQGNLAPRPSLKYAPRSPCSLQFRDIRSAHIGSASPLLRSKCIRVVRPDGSYLQLMFPSFSAASGKSFRAEIRNQVANASARKTAPSQRHPSLWGGKCEFL